MKRRGMLAAMGGAAIAPASLLRAQPARLPVAGWIGISSPSEVTSQMEAFERGLAQLGFVEGRSVQIAYRFGEGHYERVVGFAAEMVNRRFDVICTLNNAGALAAKAATSEIPIVFGVGIDPVSAGLVASMDRPGGNATGVAILASALEPKRLELLRDLLPGTKTIGALINPDNPNAKGHATDLQAAASALGLQLAILPARTVAEFDAVFAAPHRHGIGAMLVTIDPLFYTQRRRIVELAARAALPAIYPLADFAAAGGLISYGSSLADAARQMGVYAGRILKGVRPADLPVQQPSRFELVINLGTARQLGLAIPTSIFARADEVIE